MSRPSGDRRYQLDTTIPTFHHETHQTTHSSIPDQPQRRLAIEHLRTHDSPSNTPDLCEQLN